MRAAVHARGAAGLPCFRRFWFCADCSPRSPVILGGSHSLLSRGRLPAGTQSCLEDAGGAASRRQALKAASASDSGVTAVKSHSVPSDPSGIRHLWARGDGRTRARATSRLRVPRGDGGLACRLLLRAHPSHLCVR
uniref:Uncharacterized protein n=1 Tax=Rangifer tarandus platyrhynchus TaxID=3082113 RepID=A0ACB0E6I5_RANTA|nr:unnamed protein product [Rangifer tarandus platyrhynchus]